MDHRVNTVLAAIDDSPAAPLVLQAAKAMAATIGAAVRAVHVQEGDGRSPERGTDGLDVSIEMRAGDPVEGILAGAADHDVAVVVIGARRRRIDGRAAGHVALAVLRASAHPVLVVTPDTHLPTNGRFRRVLAPLEGTRPSSDAVTSTLDDLTDLGCSIVAVHVFHPATTPRFWDQPGHAAETWGSEFLRRWCQGRSVDLHLRAGDVSKAILDVAADQSVDLIALGWSRQLDHNRAAVVRAMLERSPVPVLLVPVRQPGPVQEGQSALPQPIG